MTLYMHMIKVLGTFFWTKSCFCNKKKGYKENDRMWSQTKLQILKAAQIKSENLAGKSKMILFFA